MNSRLLSGDSGAEAGQIIATTISGRNGLPKQPVSYIAERVVGTGSFGVVFQAKCLETGEVCTRQRTYLCSNCIVLDVVW